MTAEHRPGIQPKPHLGEGFFAAYGQISTAHRLHIIALLVRSPIYTGPRYVPGQITQEEIQYKDSLADSLALTLDPQFVRYSRTNKEDVVKSRNLFRRMIDPIPPAEIPHAATAIFHFEHEQERNGHKQR